MSDERAQLAEVIFFELASVEPERREAHITQRTRGDAELASRVRALLATLKTDTNGFLDPAEVPKLARRSASWEEKPLAPGTQVGDYSIMGVLGQGGMGLVYSARQERPRRTVALKMMRASLFGSSALRRFEHEAEVLGMLQHPNIAQIYEAGAAEMGAGPQPFIAMELVDGPPINRHAREKQLAHRDIVALIATVCDAVHHAHQRGVIHRDIKPGNILVTRDGAPKVLDFGVSRAVGDDTIAVSMHTRTGQLIGTLAYMSPEQATGGSDEVDVRSDVFALGVVLFELLSGQLPFDVRTKPIPEAARIIHDTEPRRLASLQPRFRGDLDVIVSRALEKDKARRYQSAADLADDLRRYLDGAPIAAKQDSLLYVLKKQVRRHKLVSALIAVIAVVIVGFGVVSALLAVNASSSAQRAQSEQYRAEAALAAVTLERARADQSAEQALAELRASRIEQGRLLGQSGSMTLAEDLIWPEFIRDPYSEHAFWALWELYSSAPCRSTVRAHSETTRAVAFCRDGRSVITVGEDGWMKQWDAEAGGLLREQRIADEILLAVDTSPDGSLIAVATESGPVHILNASDWSCAATVRLPAGNAASLAFSPRGDLLVVGGGYGQLACFSTSDWSPRWVRQSHRANVIAVAFSPDGTRLATGANEPEARLWDAETGDCTSAFPGTSRGGCGGVAWSPDGRVLATGGTDQVVRFWDTGFVANIAEFNDINGTVNRLQFSPDGRRLAIGGWWRADILDCQSWVIVATYTGHRRGAPALSFNPRGDVLATGSTDHDLRLWDLPERVRVRRIPARHKDRVVGAWFNRDQTRLLTVGYDRTCVLWDAHTLTPIKVYENAGSAYACTGIFLGAGDRFALVVNLSSVRIYDSRDGAPLCPVARFPRQVTALGSTPDGRFLFIADGRQLMNTYDARTGAWVRIDPLAGTDPLRIAVTADGSRLDVLQRRGWLESWSLPDMRPLAPVVDNVPVWSLDESADGTLTAVGTWDRDAEIIDSRTRTRLASLAGHRQIISNVTFAPDQVHMLTSSTDGTAKWWNIRNQRCLLTLTSPDQQPFATSTIAPDGRTIVCGGFDGALYVWDLGAFDRHVAGNLENRLRQAQELSGVSPDSLEALRSWRRRIFDPRPGGEPVGGPGASDPSPPGSAQGPGQPQHPRASSDRYPPR